MTPDREDAWLRQMHDLQADLAKDSVAECVRLRAKVRELETKLASHAPDMWAMQERITMLEQQLASSKENKA